jgi:hypothetical protein
MAALVGLSTPSYSSLSAVPACMAQCSVCVHMYSMYVATDEFGVGVIMHACSDGLVSAEAVLCSAAYSSQHTRRQIHSERCVQRVLLYA